MCIRDSTYPGHTACLAAGVAVQRIIAAEGLLERVRTRGPQWRAELGARFAGLPEVGDLRGRGFFVGLELVRDPATKEPFDPALKLHERIRAEALDRGLICYPMGGNVDGVRGDVVILAPPYNATEDDLGEIAEKLEAAVRAALAQVR
ncbi:MAG: aminotransferase class III-fold pyridoxal phosphate-dependent enzyme, partial [Rhodobacteraceae bacterium]|nr:aminotransferase class III-fold pyridoxal phosphate-dependent enzyme [Paracoccaceae bacterium]